MTGNGELIQQENRMPPAPGFGVAGMVMCPYLHMPCLKSGCELFVSLTYAAGTKDQHVVGHCAVHWNAVVTTEITNELKGLTKAIKELLPKQEPV